MRRIILVIALGIFAVATLRTAHCASTVIIDDLTAGVPTGYTNSPDWFYGAAPGSVSTWLDQPGLSTNAVWGGHRRFKGPLNAVALSSGLLTFRGGASLGYCGQEPSLPRTNSLNLVSLAVTLGTNTTAGSSLLVQCGHWTNINVVNAPVSLYRQAIPNAGGLITIPATNFTGNADMSALDWITVEFYGGTDYQAPAIGSGRSYIELKGVSATVN